MALDNPLWRFALDLYARPGVEAAALELQSLGCSINRLILACFLAQKGCRLMPELLRGEAQQWQNELTHPLRALRYKVRARKADNPELDPCYRKLREAELACEQVEIMLLWQCVEAVPEVQLALGEDLLRGNIEQIVAEMGDRAVSQASSQIDAFITVVDPGRLASG
ncbi:TIGR02444 family protein [Marinobacterium lutimaris]|uniref:TIGR02444 family protein n=1 Tax=Marinobacterium lutimaris TaxID=568106 RepID=A0A1H6CZX7_9GAMM|nr:TIGR02444 family protein [Marinobacterium lutimaris]SEG78417.1 TIGR02444 family protein [Marinobacterium lutimaris]